MHGVSIHNQTTKVMSSNKQSFTPFYEVASRSVNTPARDKVNAEAERRNRQMRSKPISELSDQEKEERFEAMQAEMKKDAWILDASSPTPTPEQIAAEERRFQEMKKDMEREI